MGEGGGIREDSYKFIKSVYNSGGQFALRGYFTKEFFDALGFKEAVVTGCPSFYQMGRELKIIGEKVDREMFRPLINGTANYLKHPFVEKIFREYRGSVYMDQDDFMEILYSKEFGDRNDVSGKSLAGIIQRYSLTGARLLAEGRVKLYYDVPALFDFYRREGFNFSFGRRIHGNIAPMLVGIPSLVHCQDLRTRELAEFFDMPMIFRIPRGKSLYELYLEADYSKFNAGFSDKFDRFEQFMTRHGLSHDIGDRDDFMRIQSGIRYAEPETINAGFIDRLGAELERRRFYRGVLKLREVMYVLVKNALFAVFTKDAITRAWRKVRRLLRGD